MAKIQKIAIVGNPNSGKSTIFNFLTGLSQRVGNFPGVTVESKEGKFLTFHGDKVKLTDLPGAYSLYTNSKDELVLSHELIKESIENHTDAIIYVADLRYLNQQLLLLTQVLDLNYPTMIILSNKDLVDEELANNWIQLLADKTNCIVHAYSSRLAYTGITLKEQLNLFIQLDFLNLKRIPIYEIPNVLIPNIQSVEKISQTKSTYQSLVLSLDEEFCKLKSLKPHDKSFIIRHQIAETMSRYSVIENWETQILVHDDKNSISLTKKLDRVLTHPIWGIGIFILIMFLVFQLMYSWAEFPMNAIEKAFAVTAHTIRLNLPDQWWAHLITDGIIPGLAGVLVFIPQIMILFFMLCVLEEAGYMTRVVYLLDHLLSKFGLNGRSIIGLISGGACAIPAIMSTRSIYNKKERFISMFVIPLIPCSARIPVYTALIGFVVSPKIIIGIFNLQGLVFMGLYVLGIFMALMVALILHKLIKSEGSSFLIMQLPNYQVPQVKQVFFVVYQKVKSFVLEAGKVIMLISIVLWFLATFSWPGEFDKVEKSTVADLAYQQLSQEDQSNVMEAKKLEHSFAGKFGKIIEPIVKPIGFDWKIGIALITSFAAREVFVGTMSTIYSIGSNGDELKLREILAAEKRPDGSPFFNTRTALSLIIFYAFAMQCMSTMSVMRKESGNWKTPLVQFIFFGLLAYVSSFVVYHLF
ncbi:MAG: ferrous iron transport protein B [Saprospiraceae bacterium]